MDLERESREHALKCVDLVERLHCEWHQAESAVTRGLKGWEAWGEAWGDKGEQVWVLGQAAWALLPEEEQAAWALAPEEAVWHHLASQGLQF